MSPAEETDLERPFRSAEGVAVPTLLLAASVLLAFVVSTFLAVRGTLPVPIAIPIQAALGYLAFTPAHEAIHGNIAGRNGKLRGLERAIGWVMTAIFALPFSLLEYLHLQHHGRTNHPEDDPDHWASGSAPLRVGFRCWTIQWGYLRTMQRRLDEGSAGATKALRGMRVYGALSLAFLVASIHFGFWKPVLLLWLLPMWLAQGFLALVFDWLPHRPHESAERYRDTRIQQGSVREKLLLGQNYHLIHHLYPRLPFYAYSSCFRAVLPVLRERGARIE